MSILFVLLTVIIVMSVNYLYLHVPKRASLETRAPIRLRAPILAKEAGFSIPQGYSFHPGHTWVLRDGGENARVGLDKFAADLVGSIERIEVANSNRWIRQGQRLATVHSDGLALDVLSPIEGVVVAVNDEVVKDPALAAQDPYKNGWIATVKCPDFPTNQKNLLQGPMVAPWMHYNVSRLNAALAQMNPEFAQDGGAPLSMVLQNIEPAARHKLIKDFFLN